VSREIAVFGLHAAEAVLRREPERVRAVFVDRGRRDARLSDLRALAEAAGLAVQGVPAQTLERQCEGGRHQGIVLRYRPAAPLDESQLLARLQGVERPLVLVLDGVTDPHNLGACLRTAEAAGVDAVVVPRDRAAGLSPVVRKVASGAAETLAYAEVTNLARTLDALKAQGLWVVGAAGEAEQELHACDLSGPLALVLGAEGSGLRRLTRARCDLLLRIPMRGAVASLNVSVAAGVCLYEALRQRAGPSLP
jgi:23S rRNA (guanosine2251-2'-O)-methyltransferase